ncbi:MAG: VOC family protein [Cyclobacteriaceae bacterium]|nr:VOC family protein [Cyclobacteriaceae bacterium]
MNYVISGIQQIGIGVKNANEAWSWYRKNFGFDTPVFKDSANATLMTRYTAGIAESRYAILAMNMQGGGGFEIWQYTSKEPEGSSFSPQLGDTGVFSVKLKSINVQKSFDLLRSNGAQTLTLPVKGPGDRLHFFVTDPYGNIFEIIESNSWFKKGSFPNGGVTGVTIGVTDIDKALAVYQHILGHNSVAYDVTGTFDDLSGVPGGDSSLRRILLKAQTPGRGAFGNLLGSTEIELIEVKGRKPRKIYENRNWGDLGFIHVCFDVRGMNMLGDRCDQQGHPFTVDSNNSFDMGKAAGHFSYIEDKDGTLIEFVETHKLPIIEKLGLFLNIKDRPLEKPLPNWMLGMLSLNRVKD